MRRKTRNSVFGTSVRQTEAGSESEKPSHLNPKTVFPGNNVTKTHGKDRRTLVWENKNKKKQCEHV